ncbi:MAG: 50S ribosomal protein L13 [Candidatus Colwellbacteria bacterium RIFCSPLOWO2_01_FULL_48_10]|uniref:Large ribosomal subunit protein uL13 n=1 Tax=Candidatus Colwellbacteria bacterium RIFCSPLOWO2_01_FULL_48_10 TaxID=1797690 RepID=A0A1G1Z5C5_9BACT|nr:MAG: 50S ribosomal protein L13 [Candidatus Colwellbacteria bacterium RIFCSPLOWO2_01_FULL_48_10]
MDHIIDAKNQTLGRLASKIAHLLQGKDSVKYEPREIGVNRVVVKNIEKIKVTGNKAVGKVYYRHTGYMGHLREKTYSQIFAESPEKVLQHAVRGMLPKNFIRDRRMRLLVIEKPEKSTSKKK